MMNNRRGLTSSVFAIIFILGYIQCVSQVPCQQLDSLGVLIVGSSVAKGVGANDLKGYAYKWDSLMTWRHDHLKGRKWSFDNRSVGGDNTVKVLNRWQRDVASHCAKYVVIGLSMGNEGIHEHGAPIYHQFKNNLDSLILLTKMTGKVPIIINNYSRGDYTDTDFDFIKKMNLYIHQLRVPSVNVLGTIDNGQGQWMGGYRQDVGHPNTAGHHLYFEAVVPSMLDALDLGKSMPSYDQAVGIDLMKEDIELSYIPEPNCGSFSFSVEIMPQIESHGKLYLDFGDERVIATIMDSHLKISTTKDSTMFVEIQPSRWNYLTISYARHREELTIYLNREVLQTFKLKGGINLKDISITGAKGRNITFHRSSLNEIEVSRMHEGSLLHSSLELYVPVNSKEGQANFKNIALSTSEVKVKL